MIEGMAMRKLRACTMTRVESKLEDSWSITIELNTGAVYSARVVGRILPLRPIFMASRRNKIHDDATC
jgi:hypothetical protein